MSSGNISHLDVMSVAKIDRRVQVVAQMLSPHKVLVRDPGRMLSQTRSCTLAKNDRDNDRERAKRTRVILDLPDAFNIRHSP